MPFLGYSQNLDELEDYSVDKFYKKVNLDYGTLDEDGNSISYVYVKTTLDDGLYDITISDGNGDLYEVDGHNLYIKFDHYYGLAGLGEEVYLEVSSYSATVYKKD